MKSRQQRSKPKAAKAPSGVPDTRNTAPVDAAPAMSPWLRRAFVFTVVVLGALIIAWGHRWHMSPGVFFLWMGWLAVILSIYFLWFTGTATAHDEADDAEWFAPIGHAAELEREKQSLLKAIKEIEFDHQLGKVSADDAALLTKVYRARAIEVIKALDAASGGAAESIRAQIQRELAARVAVEEQKRAAAKAADKSVEKTKKNQTADAKAAAVDEAEPS